VTVEVGPARQASIVNQRRGAAGGWHAIGRVDVPDDGTVVVSISNANVDGHVVADAVQLLPVGRD
jgi:hypothetical protein